MKRVDQTTFVGAVVPEDPKKAGNCFQACVASLLELELDEVPHFVSYGAEWWDRYVDFLDARGFRVIGSETPVPFVYGLAFGKSPHGDFNHIVVTFGGDIVHDPHPSRDGLRTVEGYEYWLPMNPTFVKVR